MSREVLTKFAYELLFTYVDKSTQDSKRKYDLIKHVWTVVSYAEKEAEKFDIEEQDYATKMIVVAILHDIVEDTPMTLSELKKYILDKDIIDAVDAITRRKDEDLYYDYILRVSKNDLARRVKIFDLTHNMDITRLSKFGKYEQKRLVKYWNSYMFLNHKISQDEFRKSFNNV